MFTQDKFSKNLGLFKVIQLRRGFLVEGRFLGVLMGFKPEINKKVYVIIVKLEFSLEEDVNPRRGGLLIPIVIFSSHH